MVGDMCKGIPRSRLESLEVGDEPTRDESRRRGKGHDGGKQGRWEALCSANSRTASSPLLPS